MAVVAARSLCGTLALRAAQLFNAHANVLLLALRPCCLPSRRQATQNMVYEVGGHTFSARELYSSAGSGGGASAQRREAWAQHVLASTIAAAEGNVSLERAALRPQRGAPKELFLHARSPAVAFCAAAWAAEWAPFPALVISPVPRQKQKQRQK